MILEMTVTGPEDYLQYDVFTSVYPIVLACSIQLDETQRLVRLRRSRSLPIMGTEHRLKGNEHRLSDSQVIGVMRVDAQPKAPVFLRKE